ncbi:MAG: hypothetical protein CL536_04325 [Alcaligenaceae bacterium]|nr:hypothetical protein [Alcaligenaceae bacterium]
MQSILNIPEIKSPSAWTMPTILTGELLQRMSVMNHTARKLRALGFRIIDEDVSPDDGGSPIIQLDLRGLTSRPLQHLAACAVVNTEAGYERVTIEGVRVFWNRGS